MTVDWVVLSAAVIGLGIVSVASTASGVTTLGTKIGEALGAIDVAGFFPSPVSNAATHYFDLGISQSPDNRTDAWRNARIAAQQDAPEGYNYDPDFNETRYVDAQTGMPVYEADDGMSYSIGGKIVSASDYDPASSGTSFRSTFNSYWGS